jgi:ABC-type multidrug transport system fused ATPase/permease subunit
LFIDSATHGAAQRDLLIIAAAFLAASLVQQGLLVGATYLSERVAWTATNALRADLAAHALSLDPAFHAAHTPGELIERIDGDVTNIASFFSQFVIQVIGNVLLLLGILVMLWTSFDARVGAVLTIFATLALAIMVATRAVSVPYWVRFREASARLFGFIEEHLVGLEDLVSLGAGPYVLHHFGERARQRLRAARWARLLSSIPWGMPIVMSAIGIGLTYGLSVILVQAGELTIGGAFTLYFYTRLLFLPLMRISSQLEEFQRASAGVVRVQQLRSWRSSISDPANPCRLPDGPLSVELAQVDFAYRADELVLRQVSFAIEPGRMLGIVGRTGSGKTTITRLLVRLCEPRSGSVRVGGLNVHELSRKTLRQRVGLVMQQPHLFGASVHDNLTLFDASISDERVLKALEQLGIAEWALALPEGLQTRIGPGGRGVSAGEAQLLGLVRAFLADPSLVILDEPSSRIDQATERLVNRAVRGLLRERTGLIVAHRLATLDHVDSVVVLDEGRVVEHGPRTALASDPASRFAALLRVGLAQEPAPA